MSQASADIKQLRRENEIMRARWEGVDIAMQLLYATPPTPKSIGISEDIAWKIDKILHTEE
jgi:hypothetical protein